MAMDIVCPLLPHTRCGIDAETIASLRRILLPYLLFAYREVPQSSTGFSPFELLYGHTVRGPLDILKESCQGSIRGEESVVSHVLAIRERLYQVMEKKGRVNYLIDMHDHQKSKLENMSIF